MVDLFAGSGTTAQAPAADRPEAGQAKHVSLLPPGLDPARHRIILTHWYGLDLAHEAPEAEEAA